MRRANYAIVSSTPEVLTLRDLGPWDRYMTITNAAEDVVEELSRAGTLKEGQRLLYYDSENDLTELKHGNGKFVEFAAP